MINIKVYFENKDHLITKFNGTFKDAETYYINNMYVIYVVI